VFQTTSVVVPWDIGIRGAFRGHERNYDYAVFCISLAATGQRLARWSYGATENTRPCECRSRGTLLQQALFFREPADWRIQRLLLAGPSVCLPGADDNGPHAHVRQRIRKWHWEVGGRQLIERAFSMSSLS